MSTPALSRYIVILSAALVLAACASAPDWIYTPPADTAGEVFFTGVGSDSAGDTAKAEEAAQDSLVSSVTKYLGTRVSSESTVETIATLESYKTEINELIREESSAYVSDLRIVDKHTAENRDGSVVVHLLGSYDKNALTAEKERIAALFAERIEAVAGPERDGDELLSAGGGFRGG